jgi:eukaryotic-like serine/threonine-protein kinase
VTEAAKRMQPAPFGKYLLLERIGTGGMAEIFRAKTFGAAGFEKEYAIKRILPNLSVDEEFVSMFVNEAKLMVDLYHANIVQVFDLGELEGTYYIAMEFVHGKDLLDLLARCAENDLKIPLKLTLCIAMEILKGLDFAHKATDKYGEPLKIIHRDVSPSNIMLSYAGDVKIGDFGVAKAKIQTQRTEAGTLKGKVGYMSPEQVRGDEIDHRSDVFAAGIILYEALTMTRLFMGGSDLDVMLKVRDADIESELRRCRRVPPTLLGILRRALSKDREERFQSAEEFYRALREFAYRQDIQTSNRDVATFLHRVFRDEIEAEKSRRRQDPKLPLDRAQLESLPSADRAVWEGLAEGSYPGVRTKSAGEKRPPDGHATTPPRAGGSPEDSWTARISGEIGYRYRDAGMRTYGPMSLQDLQALLSSRPESDLEAVAVGDGPWLSPDDLPQLWEVSRPDPYVDDGGVGDGAFSGRSSGRASPTLIPTHRGRFGRITLTRLLFRLARRRCTGMLRIEWGPHHKELFFRRGDPVLVTSSMPEELLGNYLLKRQIISEAELEQALARLTEFGGRLGDSLVGERLVSTHDLFRYLTEQLQDRILGIFAWPDAEWSFFPDSRAPHQAVPLGIDLVDLLMEGVRNHLSAATLRAHFEGRENEVLERIHSRLAIDDLPLTPSELEVVSAVVPGHTPLEVVSSGAGTSPARERIAWRLLYILMEFEVFRVGPHVDEPPLPG